MITPTNRHASPQAWRRLKKTMTDGELRDIALDLAAVTEQPISDLLEYGLIRVDWNKAKQI